MEDLKLCCCASEASATGLVGLAAAAASAGTWPCGMAQN